MKIPPVEDELFHVGGRTDMAKIAVAFRDIFERACKTTII